MSRVTHLGLEDVSLLKDLGNDVLLLVSAELVVELGVRSGVKLTLVSLPGRVSVKH